jgi:two-component system, OmpR family, sensor kinase
VSRLRRLGGALRSLRWRLTLTYVGLLAALLGGLGAYQYLSLRQSLIDSRVASLSGDLDAGKQIFLKTKATTAQTSGQALAAAVATASGHQVSVTIFNRAGVKLGQSPRSGPLPQLDPADLHDLAAGSSSAYEVVDAVDGPQLVAGFPIDAAARGIHAVAQLAVPMAALMRVLDNELALLLLGCGIALALALIAGLLLTSRALRPLRRLTVTAGQLAGGDLRARSRLVPGTDEVGELTAAFDHMADRIEDAFTVQRESEARVRRFIADASHELRTPLTALKGYIDVIRRGAARDPASLDAALEAMARESERMRVLVLDLLMLARIDSHADQAVEDFDLGDSVGRLLDEGVTDMPALLERDFPEQPVIVRCDRSAVSTVVRNLLVNACKYAPGAPQHWTIRAEEGRARIDARDDGPGIPAADLGHVFERFYRGEKTRNREEGGSGLGLAIVEGLVRAQGGEVAIASIEGRGTTITVWLPLAESPVQHPGLSAAAA